MPHDPGVAMGIAYAIACACVIGLIALFVTPVSAERAARAVEHLPEDYQFLAMREMDVTRRAGITVNRRRMRFIVRCIERLAREHGAIA